ncbi:exported protein of unknown function, might related with Amidohydrolase [Shewanella benthica]|uniref:Uncharacterized protein n=1 Tax=Shewanella benthica TaxID=43661 RepID=A0A330M316_9GAMM|nr:exported protein of unknown function, might related with Amidohydrolase [Shewanella benthica]
MLVVFMLTSPLAVHASSLDSSLALSVSKSLPKLEKLYLHLHQHTELSYQEKATGQRMASINRLASCMAVAMIFI